MKVLWVCNIMLPEIAKALGREAEPVGGWMSGLLQGLLHLRQEDTYPEIAVAYLECGQENVQGRAGDIIYYGFSQKEMILLQYDKEVEDRFRWIMDDFKPDIVHIFGTEYMHSLAAVRAFGNPNRTVIGIQGLLSAYAEHFMADVPLWVQKGRTFRDIVKRDNLIHQRNSFYIRSSFEREALLHVSHIIGRTDWDKACTEQINPKAAYHFCNEILRGSFYENRWQIDKIEPYSIFVSQGSYPIKGLHFMLKAMPKILERYPQAKLYVAGGNIVKRDTPQDKMRMSSYGKYICQLIDSLKLEGHVFFTGFLDETLMCDRFLRANVFVSPSSIENSPNSVGEAMLLGMPVVSSDVGGVKNMLTHEREGYIYQADAWYMISYYVNKIFEDPDLAVRLGEAAREKALTTHNPTKNSQRMLEIYKSMMERENASQ